MLRSAARALCAPATVGLLLLAPPSDLSAAAAPPAPRRPRYVTSPIACEDGTTVIPWASPSREDTLARLRSESFDVLVVGGGAVGAGVAWEAATRGLRVALMDQLRAAARAAAARS